MDIAAQQVQGKVKGIAQKGKCKEDDEIAGDGRQGIEYLCDDRTGQHQRHQPDIGEDIPEVAGDVIVNRTADADDLSADALFAVALGDDQHRQQHPQRPYSR